VCGIGKILNGFWGFSFLGTGGGGGGGDTLKINELIHNIPRDIFHPSTLKPYSSKFEGTNKDGEKATDQSSKGRDFPATKVGLGPVMFNLKPQHYFDSKKAAVPGNEGLMNFYRKKYPEVAKRFNKTVDPTKESEVDGIEERIKKLCIYSDETVKSMKEKEKVAPNGGLMQDAFKKVVKMKNDYEAGKAITVIVDVNWNGKKKTFKKSSSEVRKAGVRNWKSPETSSEELHSGLLRNLFSWGLSTSSRWMEVEERISRWNSLSKEGGVNQHHQVTPEQIAELLKIPVEDLKRLQFHKDQKQVVEVMRNHICHSTLPCKYYVLLSKFCLSSHFLVSNVDVSCFVAFPPPNRVDDSFSTIRVTKWKCYWCYNICFRKSGNVPP